MEGRSVCPEQSRSRSILSFRGGWGRDPGNTMIWSVTRRWGSAPPSSRFGSIVLRKSRCTVCCVIIPVLVRAIAQTKSVEEAREHHLADNEQHDTGHDVSRRKAQQVAAGERRKQRFRNLIETAGSAARRQIQATLAKAGEEVTSHRETARQEPDLPGQADKRCTRRRRH